MADGPKVMTKMEKVKVGINQVFGCVEVNIWCKETHGSYFQDCD